MKTIKSIATAVALTTFAGMASANFNDVIPAFPTVETHTAQSVGFFDMATGAGIGQEFYAEVAQIISNDTTITAKGNTITFANAGDKWVFNAPGEVNNGTVIVDVDIVSDNKWYNHGSGSMDAGNGWVFSLGYGETDASVVANFSGDLNGSAVLATDTIHDATFGLSRVIASTENSATSVGATYGTSSGMTLGMSAMEQTKTESGGMIQKGISLGHNVDSGITGFGAMVGFDNGIQPKGFDGAYAGFSLTDGLMSVGVVDVDKDGTRHNLTLNPIGIVINTLMGNDTVLTHDFNK